MIKISFHPQAKRFLNKLSNKDRKQVIKKIELLQKKSISHELDIKKLAGTKQSYRLRIRNIRILFEFHPKDNTIYIWEIDFRGNIY